MRNPLLPTLFLGLLVVTAHAASPVHITLKASATVTADAEGFFTLGSVADLSGGAGAERDRLKAVPVGRAPLPDQVRRLTRGDIFLKMRQAGFNPDAGVLVDGAAQSAVTTSAPAPLAPPVPVDKAESRPQASRPSAPPTAADAPLVHRGDAVTIVIQDGDMSISARGVAREAGGAGAVIHVHRDGVMNDLSATVLDAQTVQLEL